MNEKNISEINDEKLEFVVGGQTDEEIRTEIFTCPFCGGTDTEATIGRVSAHFGKCGWISCHSCNCTYEVIFATNKKTGRGYDHTKQEWIFTADCTYPYAD